jgi:CheY-like chemotaxis protein
MPEFADFHVLIVDDDPELNEAIRSALAGLGLGEVRTCASRSDAQNLLIGGFAPKIIWGCPR